MKFEIRHEVDIDAPPAHVWEQLTETDAYGEWNPFVRELTGELPKARSWWFASRRLPAER